MCRADILAEPHCFPVRLPNGKVTIICMQEATSDDNALSVMSCFEDMQANGGGNDVPAAYGLRQPDAAPRRR
jgi:hypothetical protein